MRGATRRRKHGEGAGGLFVLLSDHFCTARNTYLEYRRKFIRDCKSL